MGSVAVWSFEHSSNVDSGSTVAWQSNSAVASDVQPLNALLPITLTFDGIDIVLSSMHPFKTPSPIVSSVVGRVIDSKLVQLAKAYVAMLVTPSGTVMDDKP